MVVFIITLRVNRHALGHLDDLLLVGVAEFVLQIIESELFFVFAFGALLFDENKILNLR